MVIASGYRHDLDVWAYLRGIRKRLVKGGTHPAQHSPDVCSVTTRNICTRSVKRNRSYLPRTVAIRPRSTASNADVMRNGEASGGLRPRSNSATEETATCAAGHTPGSYDIRGDSAVVRTSCATWPPSGLRATLARPRTKRALELTGKPPPASVGVPLRLPCVAELCRARHARSQNLETKGRTSDHGRRRSLPATLTPSRLVHCHVTSADTSSQTVIFDAYDDSAVCIYPRKRAGSEAHLQLKFR
jgi:hypothetical protein